jgi:hypothetical protein
MIKNTFLSLTLVSLVLFSSCKKNEESNDEKIKAILSSRPELFKNLSKQTKVNKPDPHGKFAEMTFAKIAHDFGNINQGDKVATEFQFTNTGKYDLSIYEAKGSCGCTIPEYPKTPIKPGEKGIIKVQFNSAGKSGKQEKSVFISTNTKKGNEIVKITANINEK